MAKEEIEVTRVFRRPAKKGFRFNKRLIPIIAGIILILLVWILWPRAFFTEIKVSVTPDDAAIYLDGELMGKGSGTLSDVPPGKHEVRVEHSSFGADKVIEVETTKARRSISIVADKNRIEVK